MKRVKFAVSIAAIAMMATGAVAQDANYQPDILSLDGQNSLVFPTDSHLSILNGGTIEFWVAPDWIDTTEYSPVILSNNGEKGTLYEVAIRGDKKALLLTSGDQYDSFDFNFGDGTVHHVAIVNLGDQTIAMINGEIRGASGLTFANIQSSELRVGSSKGGALPFHGVLAGLRIWDASLEPETLVEYNWKDVTSENSDHPYIENLVGFSEFKSGDFTITDKPVMPTWLLTEAETGQ